MSAIGVFVSLAVEVGQSAHSDCLEYTHWDMHSRMVATRSHRGLGLGWDIVSDDVVSLDALQIEYKATDYSDWYAQWEGDVFFHVRSDGFHPHLDSIIKYAGARPYERYEASWDPKVGKFLIKRTR